MSHSPAQARSAYGLLLVGDWVLATGNDALASLLLGTMGPGARLEFIEAVPADPTQIADALARARQRPYTVIVAGGLGAGMDDWTWVVLHALSRGEEQMLGRKRADTFPPRAEKAQAFEHGNLVLLPGSPDRALSAFRAWYAQQPLTTVNPPASTIPRILVPWTLPESELQKKTRLQLLDQYPDVLQGVVQGLQPGELALQLTASSRSRLEKALRSLRAHMRTPRTSSPTKPGPR